MKTDSTPGRRRFREWSDSSDHDSALQVAELFSGATLQLADNLPALRLQNPYSYALAPR